MKNKINKIKSQPITDKKGLEKDGQRRKKMKPMPKEKKIDWRFAEDEDEEE